MRSPSLPSPRMLVVGVALLALSLLIGLASLLTNPTRVHAAALPASFADTPGVAITKTVGLDATGCATQSSIVVPTSTTVYFCLTVMNTGNLTITSQALNDPSLGLNQVITEPLSPGKALTFTNESHAALGQSLSFTKVVTTDLTSSVTLTATFSPTSQIVANSTATVQLARASATIKKTVGPVGGVCASTTTQVMSANDPAYYCFTIQNTGNITLSHHILNDPTLGINTTLDNPLKPSTSLTITNKTIPALASNFQGIADIINTVFYTGIDGPNLLTAQAQAQAKVEVAKAAIVISTTVGVNSQTCGAHDTIGVSPGATLYYCITVKNTGNLTLTNFTVSDSLLGLNQNFSYALKPGGQLVISARNPNALAFDPSKLVVTSVQTPMADTFTVMARAAEGLSASQSANTQASVGAPVIGLFKYLEKDPTSCAPTASLTIAAGQPVYYCLRVENRGQLTLTSHRITEPATNINSQFTYTLAPDAVLTITNSLLTSALNASAVLGPFTFSTNVVNTLTFSTNTAEGIGTTASASAAVNVPTALQSPTLTPTPSITPIPSPTDTPTTVPSPTWTPTTPPTLSPTMTPAPIVVSLLPVPTSTRNFLLTGVTTPVGAAQTQGQSPLATPFNPNPSPPVSPLPTPIIDNAAVAATQAAQAAAATATGLALLTPPTPFPAATPTMTPTLTATVTLTPTRPAVAAVRPIEYPTPTPAPDFLVLFAKIVDASIAAAGWIWFVCGSLIFFVTAGVLAGLGFRRQHRPRYALVDRDDDFDDPYQTVAAPAPVPSTRPARNPADDDYWPASLP